MGARPTALKQADLTRYLKAVLAAGVRVGRVLVRPDGSVEIVPSGDDLSETENPCDVLLRK